MGASVAFGVFGLLVILTLPPENEHSSNLNILFLRLMFASVFIILPAFALSVAGKYLDSKK